MDLGDFIFSFLSPLELASDRFLRVGFFKTYLGWGVKNILEKKIRFLTSEYFPKMSLAKISFGKKKLEYSQPRNILAQKFLKRNIFEG